MSRMPRASSSWQGNRPLADTASGSPGELTGTERAKLQALAVVNAIGTGLQLVGGTLSSAVSNATASVAGLMSAADKAKLDGIAAGAAAAHPYEAQFASAVAHGWMSAAYASKLDGIAAGAQVNPGLATTGANGLMSATDKEKSDGLGTRLATNLGGDVAPSINTWAGVLAVALPAGRWRVSAGITFENPVTANSHFAARLNAPGGEHVAGGCSTGSAGMTAQVGLSDVFAGGQTVTLSMYTNNASGKARATTVVGGVEGTFIRATRVG